MEVQNNRRQKVAILKIYNLKTRIDSRLESPTELAYLQVGEFLRQAKAVKITAEHQIGLEIAELDGDGTKTKLLIIENKGTNLNLLRDLKKYLWMYQREKAEQDAMSLLTA